MRKLILQDVKYQNKFNRIDVIPPSGISKLKHIETKLLRELNNKNPRLHVSNIEYLDINSEFPNLIRGAYSALIIDEDQIPSIPATQIDDSRYFTDSSSNYFRQKIMAYVFTSPATRNEGRDITVTQDIFPRLLDYIEKHIDSPSYTYANHPFYYISLMNTDGGLPASILSNYAKLNQLEIEFIELFATGVNFSKMPKGVEETIKFIAKVPNNRRTINQVLSTNDYQFDLTNRKLTILSSTLLVNLTSGSFGNSVERANSGNATFKGSKEKFYWLDVLSMFELALRNNYEIDYSQLWSWYRQNEYSNSFGNSDKFPRFESLLKYFDKKTLKG
ncbi:hypothetical protein [Leuconostoc mesenteroides]|uniref:hypothetical protein n=1 Tax=Leuconostoc mesenteroides TaxID=1245 RepID=UPI001CBBEDF2|nr:hypothetical protein [Leuconostoc mesenteroides]MBZ1514837.1 hypothetical protein [Leuconostoc mesenteroides]